MQEDPNKINVTLTTEILRTLNLASYTSVPINLSYNYKCQHNHVNPLAGQYKKGWKVTCQYEPFFLDKY